MWNVHKSIKSDIVENVLDILTVVFLVSTQYSDFQGNEFEYGLQLRLVISQHIGHGRARDESNRGLIAGRLDESHSQSATAQTKGILKRSYLQAL